MNELNGGKRMKLSKPSKENLPTLLLRALLPTHGDRDEFIAAVCENI